MLIPDKDTTLLQYVRLRLARITEKAFFLSVLILFFIFVSFFSAKYLNFAVQFDNTSITSRVLANTAGILFFYSLLIYL